jgi:serine/threonine protein kinase/tetratricopeptide (TPR) repeat protein
MADEYRRSIRSLFDAAVERPAEERAAFLDDACAGDAALRNELDLLMAARERAGSFLEGPISPAAGDLPIALAGQRIGPYEIVREIGSGGMGSVFLAIRADDQYRKQVAIKLVHAGIDRDELVRRFWLERQILATLEHPNIARLIDGGTTGSGQPYVVMDYVEGVPIDRYCDRHALSITDRLRLFQTVCGAVEYAHQNLIVHRDLKPANILVTQDGVPKLLDFGIAKLLRPDPAFDSPAMTVTGVHLMTPEYASPEQVRSEPIGTYTDVYTLGVLLYELLTGHPPYGFQNLGTQEIARVICEQEPVKPSVIVGRAQESRPGSDRLPTTTPASIAATREGRPERLRRRLEGDLDVVVLTALRKEASRRYASVRQLSEDIGRHLDGMPVHARKDTLLYRSGKFVRRHRLAVAATILMIVTLAGGIVATVREARIAGRQRHEAEIQRARAERRFNDVRRLANSFLFEFDSAIASLPGSTPARRLVVSKALEYLDNLARESAGDAALQRELAAAYDKVGDVQGNYFVANLGDVKGSIASYQKAYAIRTALLKTNPTDPGTDRLIAVSLRNLGDGAFGAGDPAAAVTRYGEAASIGDRLLAASPNDEAIQREVAESNQRLCTTLMLTGDVRGTITRCQRYAAVAESLLRKSPADPKLLQARASNATSLGNALLMDGRLQEARESLKTAEAWFDDVLKQDPNNAAARRGQAVSRTRLANTLSALGDTAGAVATYQLAVDGLQALVRADPQSARFKTDLTYALLRRVNLLLKAGRPAEARRSASAGLSLLRAQAERPDASANDWNDYAWWLLTCDPPELREPATALQFAKRAVATSTPPNPSFLHTLGWAQYRAGNREQAVATLERTLTLLDPVSAAGPARGLRGQIQHDLDDFKARRIR